MYGKAELLLGKFSAPLSVVLTFQKPKQWQHFFLLYVIEGNCVMWCGVMRKVTNLAGSHSEISELILIEKMGVQTAFYYLSCFVCLEFMGRIRERVISKQCIRAAAKKHKKIEILNGIIQFRATNQWGRHIARKRRDRMGIQLGDLSPTWRIFILVLIFFFF